MALTIEAGASSAGSWTGLLGQAKAALDAGNPAQARACAQSVLSWAASAGDKSLEARALNCLAHGERMLSKSRRAHYASQRAARLYRSLGDAAGEAEELTVQSHAASVLGRSEEAVEAALQSIHLAKSLGMTNLLAVAHVTHGVALFFGRRFDQSHLAFDDAVRVSRQCEPSLSEFQARVTQACAEATRIVVDRFEGSPAKTTPLLRHVLERCAHLAETGQAIGMTKGIHLSVNALWQVSAGLMAAWDGDFAQSDRQLAVAGETIAGFGGANWLAVYRTLVLIELSVAKKDWRSAEGYCAVAVELATAAEHEEFACLAHLQALFVYEAQGKRDEALIEMRRLILRQRAIREEAIKSRAEAIRLALAEG